MAVVVTKTEGGRIYTIHDELLASDMRCTRAYQNRADVADVRGGGSSKRVAIGRRLNARGGNGLIIPAYDRRRRHSVRAGVEEYSDNDSDGKESV